MKFVLTENHVLLNINICDWFRVYDYGKNFIVQVGYNEVERECLFSGTKEECISYIIDLDKKINMV
jgi:hypothetical protein